MNVLKLSMNLLAMYRFHFDIECCLFLFLLTSFVVKGRMVVIAIIVRHTRQTYDTLTIIGFLTV